MALQFGTSGIRGLNTAFTKKEIDAVIAAFVSYAREKFACTEIAVAGDLRESTAGIQYLIESALSANQIKTLDCGRIPTPTLAYFCTQKKVAGIMITGSHIPADRNGIKFYWPWGEILKADEVEILKRYEQNSALHKKSLDTDFAQEAEKIFIARYTQFFAPYRASFRDKTVVVYEHSSVARDILSQVLSALDFKVVKIGRSSTFIPVDTETSQAGLLIQQELQKSPQSDKIFAVVSTDGDADRPLVCDENFVVLRGDTLGLIAASFLGAKTVVTPISSNTAIEKSNLFEKVVRTQIGSPFVIAAMENSLPAPVIGFEANGGLLLGSDLEVQGARLEKLVTRDSVLPILASLAAAAIKQVTLSQLVAQLPLRFTHSDLIKPVAPALSKKILENIQSTDLFQQKFGAKKDTNLIDGLRLTLDNDDIVHFRPSGNAPEFRCYAESSSPAQAVALVEKGLQFVKGFQ